MKALGTYWVILLLAAQGERIAMRQVPKANETFKFRMTQELDMQITRHDDAEPDPAEPTRVLGKTTFSFTEKTGSVDAQGNTPAEITYDEILVERSINGKPVPVQNVGGMLAGKTVTFTYDGKGTVIDVKAPPDIGFSGDSLKEMMGSLATIPDVPLAIGETATMPFAMPLPIPPPGDQPLNVQGQARYKLLELSSEGGGRIARFEQTVEATLDTAVDLPLPSGVAKVYVKFTLSGGGGLQLNVDKGVVKSGDVLSTIDGNMYMIPHGSDKKTQTMTLHGTTRTSASSTH
jgi:hypothetical protein